MEARSLWDPWQEMRRLPAMTSRWIPLLWPRQGSGNQAWVGFRTTGLEVLFARAEAALTESG